MSFFVAVYPPTEACEDRSKPFSRVYCFVTYVCWIKVSNDKKNQSGRSRVRALNRATPGSDRSPRTYSLALPLPMWAIDSCTCCQLRRGNTRSCGCLQREQSRKHFTTHGDRESAEYRAWIGMIERSANQKRQGWKNYGGRGVIVCERWRHN